MTYNEENFPMCFEYSADPHLEPFMSLGLPLPAEHPILGQLHADLIPSGIRARGSAWLVCHLMKCSAGKLRLGKDDEIVAETRDYSMMQCFVPVEHSSKTLPWPAQGKSACGSRRVS